MHIHIGAPQAIYMALVVAGLVFKSVRYEPTLNGKIEFAGLLVSTAVVLGLLYWGGFFG